jgi:CysZ protein
MGLIQGISYNLRGVRLGLKTPRLLLLGMVRLAVILLVTAAAAALVMAYTGELLGLLWAKPASPWVIWLWYAAYGLLALLLFSVAALIAYLAAQVLFTVLIMDQMSRITERLVSGQVRAPAQQSFSGHLLYLWKQEIPRAVVPVLAALGLMILSWSTPAGPLASLLLAAVAAAFLAWDGTDLTPARRLQPFGERLRFLRRTWAFHLGFGLLFMIPLLNMLFLAFAPVGATLFYIETQDRTAGADR